MGFGAARPTMPGPAPLLTAVPVLEIFPFFHLPLIFEKYLSRAESKDYLVGVDSQMSHAAVQLLWHLM